MLLINTVTMSNNTPTAPLLAATMSDDELSEKPEIANRLKISIRTLDEWMRDGRVPFLKIGKTVRFHWPEVLAHLNENCRVN
jgi:excisionase family DNA binding protein